MKLPYVLAGATASTILAMVLLAAPARAQTYDPRYPVCLQIYQSMVDYYFECGFTSMARYKGGNLKGWDGWRYMPRFATRYDNSPAKVPWDFSEVLSFLGDRAIFINAPLRDDNFDNSGVRDCVRMAGPKTVAVYPDVAHEFPDDIRAQAYDFIEKNLKPQ